MTLDAADVIGLIGSAILVAGYAYSNKSGRVDMVVFNALNLVGAVLLLASLTVHFNLASLLLEVVWSGIALYGLAKTLRARRGAA